MSDIDCIKEALDSVRLPDWIRETSVEIFEDASGEEAALVRVVLRDGRDEVLEDARALNEARAAIHRAVDRSELTVWPYVRFISASEAA